MKRGSASSTERGRAAQLLAQVVLPPNRTIDQVLSRHTLTPLESELLYGVTRRLYTLRSAVQPFLRQPFRRKDGDVEMLLLVGAYQLYYTDIPSHTAVDETVGACASLRKPWAKGLINAVLRKVADSSVPDTDRTFEQPTWLVEKITESFQQPGDILGALSQRAPMTLRVNRARIEPERYVEALQIAGIEHDRTWHAETITLKQPMAQARLPGFADGWVATQDAAAQFAAHLLGVQPGELWLDACAAPGGKLFHGIELQPESRAVALELKESRAGTLRQEAERLGHQQFTLLVGDAESREWWAGEPFDRILLDSPCSGTGTIRRNPDIRLHQSPEGVLELVELQHRLLANLWQMLKPGGSLLYCTCSILRQENDDIIRAHLDQSTDAMTKPIELPCGQRTELGWQLLPTDYKTDGFYYAQLMKAS